MLAARVIFAVASVLVVTALWYGFRPQPAAPVQAEVIVPAIPVVTAPVKHELELMVRDGKPVAGTATLKVRQGDRVALRIESNRYDELHVHGYDLKLKLKGGEPASLEFAATRSGRFELELHRRHTQLGALEVYPK